MPWLAGRRRLHRRYERKAQQSSDGALAAEQRTIRAALKALPRIWRTWKQYPHAAAFDEMPDIAGLTAESFGLTEEAADWMRVKALRNRRFGSPAVFRWSIHSMTPTSWLPSGSSSSSCSARLARRLG